MRARSERFDRVITSSHELAVRVDVLFNRQVIIGGEGNLGLNITSGEITYDSNAAIMARCSIKTAEPTRLPTVTNGGPLSPYGYELQIWRGINYTDGEQELVSLGVFPIQKAAFDGVTLTADLEGLDRAKLVTDAKFLEDYPLPAGTNTGTAIQALIDAGVPGLTYAFETTAYTTPSIVFAAGSDRWEAARALAKSIGCEVFFDGVGRCVLRQIPGAQTTPALIVSEGGTLVSASLDLDREPAFNRVVVTGENSSNAAVYRGVATDDDPGSPTAWDGPFGNKPMFYPSPHVTSNEQAATVAAALLRAVSGVARSLNLSMVPNPALEPGDVMQTARSSLGIDELYIVDGFTIGLTADAVMGLAGVDVWRGSMMLKARFILAVTADVPVDPTNPGDPAYTGLTDENFDDGGLDGDVPSTLNTSAAAYTGTLTLTLDSGQAKTGGLAMLVDGTAQHFGTFGADYPTHGFHYLSPYWYHERNGSADAWLWGIRDGTDSADACQIGLDSTGHIILRDGGSGAVDATSTIALPVGAWYRWCITAGASVLSAYVLTGASESSLNMADALASATCAITPTSFTNDKGGLLVAISATGSATGNLQNESFEAGSNGDIPSTSNTTYDVWSGSGVCTISTINPQDGTRCLAISGGASSHTGRKNHASHAKHVKAFRYRHEGDLTTGNGYVFELRDGGGTVVAGQFGIQSDGKVRIRDGNSGTAAVSAAAVTKNVYYDYVLTFDPSQGTATNRFICQAYLTSTGVLQFTLNSATLTATNFSNEIDGYIPGSSTTGTMTGRLDHIASDTTTAPYGTSAVGIKGRMDRYKSDSATMPPPLTGAVTPPPPPTTGKHIPAVGAYTGATAGTVGTQGSSSISGLSTYMTITGNIPPHLLHIYQSGTAWTGIPTANERTMLRPSGRMPSIPFWTWKPNGSLTWAQIAAGNAATDTAIKAVARGLAQYGHPQFLGIQHEPDNDGTLGNTGYTFADYVAMFRHVVLTMRAEWARIGVVNDADVAFVMNYVGYSGLVGASGATYNAMYPGDDVVDWIAYDPYWDATSRTGLDLNGGLFNENIAGTSGWTAIGGFYAWATTARTNFTGTKPIMTAEYGPSFRALTDTQAATRLQQLIDGIADYPQIKAMVYWNSTTPSAIDSQLYGHPLSIAKYKTFVEMPYMTQTIT